MWAEVSSHAYGVWSNLGGALAMADRLGGVELQENAAVGQTVLGRFMESVRIG